MPTRGKIGSPAAYRHGGRSMRRRRPVPAIHDGPWRTLHSGGYRPRSLSGRAFAGMTRGPGITSIFPLVAARYGRIQAHYLRGTSRFIPTARSTCDAQPTCHCEDRSDEAIPIVASRSISALRVGDCVVAALLAMTPRRPQPRVTNLGCWYHTVLQGDWIGRWPSGGPAGRSSANRVASAKFRKVGLFTTDLQMTENQAWMIVDRCHE